MAPALSPPNWTVATSIETEELTVSVTADSWWDLHPHVHHLNHGSFGAVTVPVQRAQVDLQRRMEQDTMKFFTEDYLDGLSVARDALAQFLGARPEDLVFVRNATEGVSTVLASLGLGPDDEVLVNDHEYAACIKACIRTGAQVKKVALGLPVSSPESFELQILEAVGPQTRLVLLSHVTSPTGLVFPIESIATALSAKGVLTLIDGAHAPGMLALSFSEIEQSGVDFYTANLHKWVCAPKGCAFLWVPPRHQGWTQPLITSHGYDASWPGRTPFQTRFDWTGTDDPTAFLVLPEALQALRDMDPDGVDGMQSKNRSLALAARRILLETLGGQELAPESMIGSLAAVGLPDDPGPPKAHALAPSRLQAQLHAAGFRVPISDWPKAPRRLLRISAHRYNRLEEYERLAVVTRSLLQQNY